MNIDDEINAMFPRDFSIEGLIAKVNNSVIASDIRDRLIQAERLKRNNWNSNNQGILHPSIKRLKLEHIENTNILEHYRCAGAHNPYEPYNSWSEWLNNHRVLPPNSDDETSSSSIQSISYTVVPRNLFGSQ